MKPEPCNGELLRYGINSLDPALDLVLWLVVLDRDSNRLSFPSGHTSNSFMWATVVSHYYGKKAAIPAYAVAAYVGASRLKTRKHYLTDIIAGATFGYIVGRTVTKGAEKSRNRRFNWGITVPPGGGAAVVLEIRPR